MFDFITNLTVEAILPIMALFLIVFDFLAAVYMLEWIRSLWKQILKAEDDKRAAKNRKALTSDIIKMTKASVPESVMEEFVRSAHGTTQRQDNKSLFHQILKAACEAVVKALNN